MYTERDERHFHLGDVELERLVIDGYGRVKVHSRLPFGVPLAFVCEVDVDVGTCAPSTSEEGKVTTVVLY